MINLNLNARSLDSNNVWNNYWDYSNYNMVKPVVKPTHMERDDIFNAVLRCYKTHYMKQLPKWDALKDEFKKELLFKGLKAIMENSFLQEHMGKMGKMPAEVAKYVNRFGEPGEENTKDDAVSDKIKACA